MCYEYVKEPSIKYVHNFSGFLHSPFPSPAMLFLRRHSVTPKISRLYKTSEIRIIPLQLMSHHVPQITSSLDTQLVIIIFFLQK